MSPPPLCMSILRPKTGAAGRPHLPLQGHAALLPHRRPGGRQETAGHDRQVQQGPTQRGAGGSGGSGCALLQHSLGCAPWWLPFTSTHPQPLPTPHGLTLRSHYGSDTILGPPTSPPAPRPPTGLRTPPPGDACVQPRRLAGHQPHHRTPHGHIRRHVEPRVQRAGGCGCCTCISAHVCLAAECTAVRRWAAPTVYNAQVGAGAARVSAHVCLAAECTVRRLANPTPVGTRKHAARHLV